MSVSDDFLNSVCIDDLQRKIIEVLNDKELTDLEKMEILVKYIREDENND
jgi:hypothetical protein